MTTDEQQTWDPDRAVIDGARRLRAIVQLTWRLQAESVHHADDPQMPGGDVMNLLGPVANLEAWQHRFTAVERQTDSDGEPLPLSAALGGRDYAGDQVAELHPLLVLGFWEDAVRDERSQPTDLRATIPRAAEYLRSQLRWMVETDAYGDMHFIAIDALLDDLRRCQGMLENLLNEGDRNDRGAPCLQCGTRLVKVWGETTDDDRWHCHACDQWSTESQYRLAVSAAARAKADRLTATDMLMEYRIQPATLRKWAERGHVRKRRRDDSGRMTYDVAEAIAMRDREPSA